MTPQEQVVYEAESAKSLFQLDRQERWQLRRDLAWYWFIFGVAVYALLFDHPSTWSLIVCLALLFYWGMRYSIAERKREKKQDALSTILTELDSDHDYEATQARWDAYYFGVTGYHPNSTITLSRKER